MADDTRRVRRAKFQSILSKNMLVLLGILFLLQTAEGYFKPDGTYVKCGASAELVSMHALGKIHGGVNTIREMKRKSCDSLTYDEIRFRTYDGTCNHAQDKSAAFSEVKRMMQPYYQDGIGSPRDLTKKGRPMPSARWVSLAVHTPKETKSPFTLFLMQVAQFLDHDLDLVHVPTEFNKTLKCCGVDPKDQNRDCYPIIWSGTDPTFKDNCIEFFRSDSITFSNGTVDNPRRHENALTGFVDASNVYGSDDEMAHKLRAKNGTSGLMATSWYKGKERLPKGHDDDCITTKHTHFCAMAGDERVNEHPGLTAIHTLFVLEHNRLVRKLAKVVLYRRGVPYTKYAVEQYLDHAPAKIQERIYQIVRKVLGAVWQNIVYNEFLPIILGPYYMSYYKLSSGKRIKYNPDVDPSIAEEFLTCAYRFGHSLVAENMLTDEFRALKTLFAISEHNLEFFEKIIPGLISKSSSEKFDTHMVPSLTQHLFQTENRNLDLAALNLQRARDHGTARFNEMRKYFNLKPFKHWEEFGDAAKGMKSVYEDIDDVECFPGGTGETHVKGGLVGPLFASILGQQFHDLKYGDRYFYETTDYHRGFYTDQLRSLTKLTLSKIICENVHLPFVQKNALKHADYNTNPVYRCDDLEDVDMWYWSYFLL